MAYLQFVDTNNFLLLPGAITAIVTLMPFLFLVCYVGEHVTTVYLDLKDSIYNISWFLCPLDLQRYIVPMLMNADKPVYFESFGTLNCTNDTFKRVILRCSETTPRFAYIFRNDFSVIFVSYDNSVELIRFQIVKGGYTFFMALRSK